VDEEAREGEGAEYGRRKEEKPRSRVIPRSWDWGCLSRLAVDRWVDRARTKEVFPESTWPMTPTLMLKGRAGWEARLGCGEEKRWKGEELAEEDEEPEEEALAVGALLAGSTASRDGSFAAGPFLAFASRTGCESPLVVSDSSAHINAP